jgi:predicted ArsR family transcriptional regulator
VKVRAEGFEIKEISCPYKHVSVEHPEICLVDETMISKVFATAVEKTHCVLDGDPFCCYIAPAAPVSEIRIIEG